MPIVKIKQGSTSGLNWSDLDVARNTIVPDSAMSTDLAYPNKMCCDLSGDLYFCCRSASQAIYKVAQSRTGYSLVVLAGNPSASGFVNSTTSALDARFDSPEAICYGKNNVIYVADSNNHVIRYIKGGEVGVYFGRPGVFGSTDGDFSTGTFSQILDMCYDKSGIMYISEFNKITGQSMVRKIRGSKLETVAGGLLGDAENVPASPSIDTFAMPESITTNNKGDVFVCDPVTEKIKKISGGWVSRYSGDGLGGGFSFGTAPSWFNTCSYENPLSVCSDNSKNIYVSDSSSKMILRVDEFGRPRCIANFGTLVSGLYPSCMAINKKQEIYVYLTT